MLSAAAHWASPVASHTATAANKMSFFINN